MERQEQKKLENIPPEVLFHIFSLMDFAFLVENVAPVCKKFQEIVFDLPKRENFLLEVDGGKVTKVI